MNSMILMQAIGNIDSKYIEEAAPSRQHEALLSFKANGAETSTKAAAKTNNAKILNILAGVAVFAVAITGIVVIYMASEDPVNTGIGTSLTPPSVETPSETAEIAHEPPNFTDFIVGGVCYTTVNVNMRSRPATFSDVVVILEEGTAVEVIEIEETGWVKVSHDGAIGYIRADLLSSSLPDEQEQIAAVMITTAQVNVRSGPSSAAEIITILEAGIAVDVLADEDNGWLKVRAGDITGYIRADLLSVD